MKKVICKSSELQAGDLIHLHGAVVRLQGEPVTWPGNAGRTVYAWQEMPIITGRIYSWEKLDTWTIQGNDLATWFVERPAGHQI